MITYNTFLDKRIINLTESFVNNEINEKEYENLLNNYLCEGLNVKSILDKIVQFFDYLVNNLLKLKTKIITICKSVLNIAKRFKPIYSVVVLIVCLIMYSSAFGSVYQEGEIVNKGEEKVLQLNIDESKNFESILNSAIGFLREYQDNGDIDVSQAMAKLISIRDNVFENVEVSEDVKEMIENIIGIINKRIEEADSNDSASMEVLQYWFNKGKVAILKNFIVTDNYKFIEIVDVEGNIIKKHSRSVNFN